MPPPAPRGLFVGRFQPFHRGHLEVTRLLRQRRPEEGLLIGIGSAQESYTPENPFTAGERFEMIEAALQEAGIDWAIAVPIPDIQRHALWVRYLEELLPPFRRIYSNNPLTRLLFEERGYSVEGTELIDRARLEGRRLRSRLRAGEEISDAVPPSIAAWLTGHGAAARLGALPAGEPA